MSQEDVLNALTDDWLSLSAIHAKVGGSKTTVGHNLRQLRLYGEIEVLCRDPYETGGRSPFFLYRRKREEVD